ncbi:hypothetical protein TNCV_2269051 [Trichonephila clavipes]|nr:hypothetical protein TNCV_2269051 [Trichonephila clavipes]
MELDGREIYSPVNCTLDSTYRTFGTPDLTSTFSVCTRRVFGGIGHRTRPSGLGSDALTTRLPRDKTNTFSSNIIEIPGLHNILRTPIVRNAICNICRQINNLTT